MYVLTILEIAVQKLCSAKKKIVTFGLLHFIIFPSSLKTEENFKVVRALPVDRILIETGKTLI